MSQDPDGQGESLEEIAAFLSSVEVLATLDHEQRLRVAAAVTHRSVKAGEALIVEGGPPTPQLYVLHEGSLDLLRRDAQVTVMTSGELLGYASFLTRTAPAFTVRARCDCELYCIPADLGLELLSREDGVRWLATTQRDALLYAARSLAPLPEVQTLPVSAVVRGAPPLCEPETTIAEAAATMVAAGQSAILVRTREGLGIVTDVGQRQPFGLGSRDCDTSSARAQDVAAATPLSANRDGSVARGLGRQGGGLWSGECGAVGTQGVDRGLLQHRRGRQPVCHAARHQGLVRYGTDRLPG